MSSRWKASVVALLLRSLVAQLVNALPESFRLGGFLARPVAIRHLLEGRLRLTELFGCLARCRTCGHYQYERCRHHAAQDPSAGGPHLLRVHHDVRPSVLVATLALRMSNGRVRCGFR